MFRMRCQVVATPKPYSVQVRRKYRTYETNTAIPPRVIEAANLRLDVPVSVRKSTMSESYVFLTLPLLMVVALPAIMVSVSRGAAAGRIPRNGSMGIRTRVTQSSNDAWSAGHTAALPVVRRTWWIALVAVPASIVGQALLDGDAGAWVALTALLVETAVLLFATKAANAAARTAHPTHDRQ